MQIVELKDIIHGFDKKDLFSNFSMTILEGEFVAIMGPSGSGKSTLLNLIGLLDAPKSGEVILFGEKNIKPYSSKSVLFLREKLGYLLQNYALVDELTVLENMEIAAKYTSKKDRKYRIDEALRKVGVKEIKDKYTYHCSGGEQQRIALARLLVKPCQLILADEPTGNLDIKNKLEVIQILKDLQALGKTIVVVTHDEEVANKADRIIYLK